MEIYRAISDFNPPDVDGSESILSFKKGEEFEIYECNKKSVDWWGARSLKDNIVGYVPSKYMQYEERKIGKLLPQDYNIILQKEREMCSQSTVYKTMSQQNAQEYMQGQMKKQKEDSLKRLSDMQNSPIYKAPEEVMLETPLPDYEDADNTSYMAFAKKLKTVLGNVHSMDNSYIEPEPDYNDDLDPSEMDQPDVPVVKPQTKDQPDVPLVKLPTKDQPDAIGIKPQSRLERTGSQSSDDGLKQSKKLLNPCIESPTRQALHKELLFNYKQGINVLQKPELSKVLQKRRETQRMKDWDEQKKVGNKRTSLELRLEERANKLKEEGDQDMKPIKEGKEPELQTVHKKITTKSTGTAGAAVK